MSKFEGVQMYESAPSALLYPELAPIYYLEELLSECWEEEHVERNFVPWFHYQAKEYLEIIIIKRVEAIIHKHCE